MQIRAPEGPGLSPEEKELRKPVILAEHPADVELIKRHCSWDPSMLTDRPFLTCRASGSTKVIFITKTP